MTVKLDHLEETLAHEAEGLFWLVYILVPILTGILAYNWLPHESYNPQRDEVIASHEVGDGERSGTVYDAWRDKKTRIIYTRDDYEEHRQSESGRMAGTWFGYGLIGCAFFAFRQSRLAGKKFITAFSQAMAVNLAIAVITYFDISK